MPNNNIITIIGPIHPYRGGISQYTTKLHNALGGCSDVQTISFKRQYPTWLYPGESDKEETISSERLSNVDYLIDVYSPISLRKASNKVIESKPDLVILNWWTFFWQPGMAYISRRLRKRGIKTVFLCHNLFDHDAKGLKPKVSKVLLKQADAYIVHASEQADQLRSINPNASILQKIHPIYDQFPAPNKELEKRGRLEILFFGFIRPYKGLDVLTKALADLDDRQVYLTVVGEPWGDREDIRSKLEQAGVPNLELHLSYVDDQAAANYFDRADIVALPYLSATGSGVVALAYHYNKPVLATRVGGLVDVVDDGETGWLVEPNSPDALAQAIPSISRDKIDGMTPHIQDFCKENSWDSMAEAICLLADNLTDS